MREHASPSLWSQAVFRKCFTWKPCLSHSKEIIWHESHDPACKCETGRSWHYTVGHKIGNQEVSYNMLISYSRWKNDLLTAEAGNLGQ